MASLAQRLTAFAQRMQAQYNNKIAPRLIPAGGDTNFTLIKANGVDYQLGWAAPPKNHFCDVSLQNGGLFPSDPAAPFYRVALNTKVTDPENLFDTANSVYTVPEDGIYLITATFRPLDSWNGNNYFGFGVHTAQQDGPHFLWVARYQGPTQWGCVYTRMLKCTKGQQLRMFTYGFPTGSGYIANAGMQIYKLDRPF